LAGQVDEYVSVTSGKSDMERTATGKDKAKTGTNTGAFAIHPLSGTPFAVAGTVRVI
jgi:hypothetical protein